MTSIHNTPQHVWLVAAVLAAGMAASGCGIGYQATLRASEANTRHYQQQAVEYQRQARDLNGQWQGIVATQRVVEGRIAAHAKAVKEEKQLAEQNASLRQRIAEAEQEVGRREAMAAVGEAKRDPRPLVELGKHLPESAYAAAVQEATAYAEVRGQYARQLQALLAQPNGSPAKRREGAMVQCRAVLEVIAEALALAKVPRAVLRDPALGEDPASQRALTAVADAQDALLAAIPDFTLRTGNQQYDDLEAHRYIEVDDRVVGLQEAIRDSLPAVRPRDGGDTRLRALAAQLGRAVLERHRLAHLGHRQGEREC